MSTYVGRWKPSQGTPNSPKKFAAPGFLPSAWIDLRSESSHSTLPLPEGVSALVQAAEVRRRIFHLRRYFGHWDF